MNRAVQDFGVNLLPSVALALKSDAILDTTPHQIQAYSLSKPSGWGVIRDPGPEILAFSTFDAILRRPHV